MSNKVSAKNPLQTHRSPDFKILNGESAAYNLRTQTWDSGVLFHIFLMKSLTWEWTKWYHHLWVPLGQNVASTNRRLTRGKCLAPQLLLRHLIQFWVSKFRQIAVCLLPVGTLLSGARDLIPNWKQGESAIQRQDNAVDYGHVRQMQTRAASGEY